MFCDQCGFRNEDGANFCERCGAPLSDEARKMSSGAAEKKSLFSADDEEKKSLFSADDEEIRSLFSAEDEKIRSLLAADEAERKSWFVADNDEKGTRKPRKDDGDDETVILGRNIASPPAEEKPAPPERLAENPVDKNAAYFAPMPKPEPKKKSPLRTVLGIIAAIVCLTAACVLFILVVMKRNGEDIFITHKPDSETADAGSSDELISELDAGDVEIITMEDEEHTGKDGKDAAGQGQGAGENGAAAGEGAGNAVSEAEPGPVTVRILEEMPVSMHDYQLANITAVNASSTIRQENVNNEPVVLFDGDETSSWQEGVQGTGIGEYVDFSMEREYPVRLMAFKLGNWATASLFESNCRPRVLSITLGNERQEVTFEDGMTVKWIEFSRDVPANAMHIEIKDVYQGSVYQDTCISEIMVYWRMDSE